MALGDRAVNGAEFGEAIGRLVRALCLRLAELGGALLRPKVLAALVVLIAVGVWMRTGGGVPQITGEKSPPVIDAPQGGAVQDYKPEQRRDFDRLLQNAQDAALPQKPPQDSPASEACQFPLQEKVQSKLPCAVVLGGTATLYNADDTYNHIVSAGTPAKFFGLSEQNPDYAKVSVFDNPPIKGEMSAKMLTAPGD